MRRMRGLVAATLLLVASPAAANLRLQLQAAEDRSGKLSEAARAEIDDTVRRAVAPHAETLIIDADGLRTPPVGKLRAIVETGPSSGKVTVALEIVLGSGPSLRVSTAPLSVAEGAGEVESERAREELRSAVRGAVEALLKGAPALPQSAPDLPRMEPLSPDPRKRPELPPGTPEAPDGRVLGAGLERHSDQFIGLFDLGLLSVDAREFVGIAQLGGWDAGAGDFVGALQFGVHQAVTDTDERGWLGGGFMGIAQVSLWAAQARVFAGIVQVAPREAHAGRFSGGVQLSIGTNRAGQFTGVAQIATTNRAAGFQGLAQIGLFNLSGPESGAPARRSTREDRFFGGLQVGLYNEATSDFYGLLQAGGVSVVRGGDMGAVAQIGVYAGVEEGHFRGLVQAGLWADTGREHYGLAQVGAVASAGWGFRGLVQVGLLAETGRAFRELLFRPWRAGEITWFAPFHGAAQVGAFAITAGDFKGVVQAAALWASANRFQGLVQVAGLHARADHFSGLLQVSPVNWTANTSSFYGLAQVGIANFSWFHHGLQIGAYNDSEQWVYGAQIGLVNRTRTVRGLQIGLVNETDSLRGLQIGLVNFAHHGGILPVTPLVNAGL